MSIQRVNLLIWLHQAGVSRKHVTSRGGSYATHATADTGSVRWCNGYKFEYFLLNFTKKTWYICTKKTFSWSAHCLYVGASHVASDVNSLLLECHALGYNYLATKHSIKHKKKYISYVFSSSKISYDCTKLQLNWQLNLNLHALYWICWARYLVTDIKHMSAVPRTQSTRFPPIHVYQILHWGVWYMLWGFDPTYSIITLRSTNKCQ